MKSFNATNAAGSCLWCGVPLRPQSTEAGLTATLAEIARIYLVPESRERELAAVRRRHDERKDKRGKHDGLFCTDGCAIAFGVAAAGTGLRFGRPAPAPVASGPRLVK